MFVAAPNLTVIRLRSIFVIVFVAILSCQVAMVTAILSALYIAFTNSLA